MKPQKRTRVAMIVGRLHVSFDRGTRTNNAPDLGLDERPTETTSGGLIRGLGSHFRSADAKENANRLGKEETRVRSAFRKTFVSAPMDGFYILPSTGAGRELIDSLDVDPGVAVGCSEWAIETTDEDRPPEELIEWGKKVQRQLADVPLGRKKDPTADGLAMLERLAKCPVLDPTTTREILSLIADAQLGAITRVELKRELQFLEVKVGLPVAPRRVAPGAAVTVESAAAPARPGITPRKADANPAADENAA